MVTLRLRPQVCLVDNFTLFSAVQCTLLNSSSEMSFVKCQRGNWPLLRDPFPVWFYHLGKTYPLFQFEIKILDKDRVLFVLPYDVTL